MEELFADFVNSLRKRFGNYDEEQHRFEKSSNSEIARELGYSDAQFSRLINGSATEGEYQRANQNLNRLVLIDQLENQLDDCRNGKKESKMKKGLILTSAFLLLCTFYFAFQYFQSNEEKKNIEVINSARDTTLKWAFETSYVKPYVNLDDLPKDCNFPCYKYQGKWSLDKSYKLPFFREQNGYHYLATEVTMYARCMSEDPDNGDVLEGYEYQRHEIWYDKRELSLSAFIDKEGHKKQEYKEMDFNDNDNFIRVASIHTFFRNEFNIQDSTIYRSGKVIGRDVDIISAIEMRKMLDDTQKVDKIISDINRIASNRLEDFSKPISCNPAAAPNANFNKVKDGDLMSFSCSLTTSRVALDYQKSYRLDDQYIKNTCRLSSN